MIAAGLLPDEVVQAVAAIDATTDVDEQHLPPALHRAAAGRRREFAAGRAAAASALARLTARTVPPLPYDGTPVGMAADGAPCWPAGVAGSITHTRTVAWCAVTRDTRITGIGIDLEPLVTPRRAARVRHEVTHPGELTGDRWPAAFDDSARLTLAFSARESLFKCLAPLTGRHFDYLDAEVVEVGLAGGNAVGRIVLRLRTSLAARWPCGACVDGRFSLADGVVATAFTVTPPAAHEPGTSRR